MTKSADDGERQRERRVFRARFVLGYALSYALDATLLALFAAAGTVPVWIPIAYGMAGLGVCSVFYGLLITGSSERFRDAHLTIFQTFASSTIMLVFLGLAPQIGILFMCVLFIVVGFASLRLSWREALVVFALITSGTGAIVLQTPDISWIPHATRTEVLLIWIWFLFTLARLTALGLVGNSLRIRLVRRQRQLTESIQVLESRTEELRGSKAAADSASLAKTRFLAAASHDLRQPIQAVNLFLGALIRTRLSDDQKEISGYLSTAVRSLGELLDGLLDISKLDAGVVAPRLGLTDTESVLRSIEAEYAPMAQAKNLHFRLFPRRQGLALHTDQDLLLRIVRNIVGNAVKYTQRGGILVGARRRGERCVIQVWDTGIGIAPEHVSQIFEEYFQIGNPERDRTKGLGLGLAIVRRLARLIDAGVECRSRLGRGTVFEISLPLAHGPLKGDTRPIPHTSEDPGDSSGFRGLRIVVIEDDVLVAKAIEKSLGVLGMAVTAFNTADDALASLEIADADFYISDLRLPGRIDGAQLLDAIQQRSAKPIYAVLLTGDTSPSQIDSSAASNWPVLFKPVGLADLLSMITESSRDSRTPESRN